MDTQTHLLPSLEDIPPSSFKFYTEHKHQISLLINDFVLRYLNSLYAEFKGDLILAIILGELAHQNISRIMRKGQIHPALDASQLTIESLRGVLVPCNPFSISEATGIPRETVRRKFADLLKHGWIERVSPRGYLITPLVGERFMFGFNIQLFEGVRLLCEQLQKIVLDGESVP